MYIACVHACVEDSPTCMCMCHAVAHTGQMRGTCAHNMYREMINTNNGIKTEQTVARPEDPTVPAEERKDHSHIPTPPPPTHPHTLHTEVDGVVIADVQRLLPRQTIELIEPEHSSTAVHDHTPHTVTHHNPVGGTPTQSSLQQLTDILVPPNNGQTEHRVP